MHQFTRSSMFDDSYTEMESIQRGQAAYRAASNNRLRRDIAARRAATGKVLIEDFRRRIGAREIRLEGLQIAPTLSLDRSVLPAIWAQTPKLMKIAVSTNVVSVGDAVFTDVTAFRFTQRDRATPVEARATADTAAPKDGAAKRRKSRPKAEPVIEALLRKHWDEVQHRFKRPTHPRPNWTQLAGFLFEQLPEVPAIGEMLPHENTVRTRLPKIYERLLTEKTVLI
jgi:hypothetical protein